MDEDMIWKEYEEIYKNRKGSLVRDGIVSEKDYQGIVFFLKEANQSRHSESEYSLANNLRDQEVGEMWIRAAEWVRGISGTTKDGCPFYSELRRDSFDAGARHEEIKKIAVININKADGEGSPEKEKLQSRLERALESGAALLREQLRLAAPRIIICGGTYEYLRKLYSLRPCDPYRNFVTADLGENKNVLIISTGHPAARGSSLEAYYALVNQYRQALTEGWEK